MNQHIYHDSDSHTNKFVGGKPDNKTVTTYGVYIKSILTMKVILFITEIGKNIKQNLEKKIISKIEGRCIKEGFIRPKSVRIINYSSGNVDSENIEFMVSFECDICYPVEGMIIECETKTITKAGIHAEKRDEDGVIPLTIFIARDHNYNNKLFNTVKENTTIRTKVIGIRFELNDPYICVIAKLAYDNENKKNVRQKGGDDEDEKYEEDQDILDSQEEIM
jgi:DNA-directed RNA polymerase subunit E'/Rpb7